MELRLVCPHCMKGIPFRKPFIFDTCPACGKKVIMSKEEVDKYNKE